MIKIVNLKYKKTYKKYIDNIKYLYYLYTLKFFGFLIFRGKKKGAYKKFNELKYNLKSVKNESFVEIFLTAMLNITPKIGLIKKRLGALKKEIPKPLSRLKGVIYAIKWFFKVLKSQNRSVKVINMVNLILDSFDNKGKVVKLKLLTYQTGISNKFLISLIKK